MKAQQLPACHLILLVTKVLSIHVEERTYDSDIVEKYNAFKNKYAISFDSMAEDAYRLEVFRKNVMFIEETNRRNLSYTLEVNKFTAMTQEEFTREMSEQSTSSSFTHKVETPQNDGDYMPSNFLDGFPSNLNWVQRGAVNSPIAQRDCGCCYAMTTIGLFEAACWLKTGVLPKLSVQEIIDCSWEQGNQGCTNGRRGNVIKYIEDYGITYSEYYPYRAKEQMCQIIFDKAKLALKPGDTSSDDVITVPPTDLGGLFLPLQKGPISVGIDASPEQWKSYKGGILGSFPCQSQPTHEVLLVGYGVEKGQSYWVIRNSWGTDWGEGGYARIIRDPKAKWGAGFCNIMYYSGLQISFKGQMSPNACR